MRIALLTAASAALYLSGSLVAAATATAGLIGLVGALCLGSGPLAYLAFQVSRNALA